MTGLKLKDMLDDSERFLRERFGGFIPSTGLILGSGLGRLVQVISGARSAGFAEIPHLARATVPGHSGRLVAGELAGCPILAMQGRLHYYEGHSLGQVTYPVRLMHALGIKVLIVTNAAGGIACDLQPGDLMLITDHINLMGDNPLRGLSEEDLAGAPRFPDLTEAYDPGLRLLARRVADSRGITLREGVYAGVFGPSYETPAEIRFLRTIGADAVGMSTVPEVIVARQLGIRVLGISCITNLAAALGHAQLTHVEVMEVARQAEESLQNLISGVLALNANL